MSAQNILCEDVISLTEACTEIGAISGRQPDRATVNRWVRRGCGGIRLEAVKVGNYWLTSRQSLTRFIEKTTAAALN